MASQKWDDDNGVIQLANTALDGLGPGVGYLTDPVVQSETIKYSYRRVQARLDFFADFELVVQYGGTVLPAVGAKVAELYLVPKVDDTNFAIPVLPSRYYRTGGPNYTSQNAIMVGSFDSFQPSFSVPERLHLRGVLIPQHDFKMLFRNAHTQAYAISGIALSLRTYRMQVA